MPDVAQRPVCALLYPGALAFELYAAAEALAGVGVRVVTPTGEDHEDHTGLVLRAYNRVGDSSPDAYCGLLVAGGNPDSIYGDASVSGLIRDFDAARLPIGAVCAGVLVLAFADILRGRRITHSYHAPRAPDWLVEKTARFWADTQRMKQPVVEDGHIVTALPEAHAEFGKRFAAKVLGH